MDVGSADCLAQYDLHITEQTSNRVTRREVYRLYLPTSLTPAFLIKLDAPPAAPMLSWSLLARETHIDHLLPPHIGYSAV
eukprot:1153467-Pelagomonas_calceolata.AAC.1